LIRWLTVLNPTIIALNILHGVYVDAVAATMAFRLAVMRFRFKTAVADINAGSTVHPKDLQNIEDRKADNGRSQIDRPRGGNVGPGFRRWVFSKTNATLVEDYGSCD